MTHAQKISNIVMLSEKVRQEIEHWAKKFPPEKRASAVIPALMAAQKENGGFLTEGLIDAVASFLNMPRIAVYEVATFYSMFELKPVGKHKICVCTNIACMLRESDEIVKYLQSKLGIEFGETTKDGRFTLKEVECLGACAGAPMMQIDEHYYENLTPQKVDDILETLERTS